MTFDNTGPHLWDIPPITHVGMPPNIVWKNTEWNRREDRTDGFDFVEWRKPGAARLPGCIPASSFFHEPAKEFMRVRPVAMCLLH